jgi:H+/Cl- antiporter ClcA
MLLIISAISTIDSTLSSCSKLVISDLKLLETNIFNGRLVMIIFSFFGLFFIMLNTKDLFTAVAVSGTAATFITPIFILNVIMNIRLSTSNLILSFITSIVGAIIYYIESQNLNNNFSLFFGLDHKYKTLLLLNLLIISLTFIYSLILKKK